MRMALSRACLGPEANLAQSAVAYFRSWRQVSLVTELGLELVPCEGWQGVRDAALREREFGGRARCAGAPRGEAHANAARWIKARNLRRHETQDGGEVALGVRVRTRRCIHPYRAVCRIVDPSDPDFGIGDWNAGSHTLLDQGSAQSGDPDRELVVA